MVYIFPGSPWAPGICGPILPGTWSKPAAVTWGVHGDVIRGLNRIDKGFCKNYRDLIGFNWI